MDRPPNLEQQNKINSIVRKHVNKAKRSKKETAWQDAQRLGMDEIRKYCMSEDLDLLGEHMVIASILLDDY